MTHFVNLLGTLFGGFVGYCLTVMASASTLLMMESGRDATRQQCIDAALAIGPIGAVIGALLGLAISHHITSLNSDFIIRGHSQN